MIGATPVSDYADVVSPSAQVGADEPALEIDAIGRRCPIPVIELAKQIGSVPVGSLIAVRSDDEAAALDIPAWCRLRDQEYVGSDEDASAGRRYLVRRRR